MVGGGMNYQLKKDIEVLRCGLRSGLSGKGRMLAGLLLCLKRRMEGGVLPMCKVFVDCLDQ